MNIVYTQVVEEVEVLDCTIFKKSISYKVRTKLAFQSNDFESLVIDFHKNVFFQQEKHYCMYFLQISKFIFEII